MDVRKIAKLAHLEITDEEVELYTPQMDEIVKYVEQLNELDTEIVQPMLGGLTAEGEATMTIREDAATASFAQRESLAEAPVSESGHFQVPKVLG
jgi:aspartyl-tRNA(Asn)/glutamyl-tRNA(Gln) amidotransferase subunit C